MKVKFFKLLFILFFSNIAIASTSAPAKASLELSTHLQLKSGMSVIIISDPNATSSAISLTIGAGQRNTPQNHEGLPHLLEHAVFLGSSSFPQTTDWDNFIKLAGGWSNASTRSDNTRYHLQIGHSHLPESLTRLSDMIFNPLLIPTSINIAISEVNEEFLSGKPSGWQRILSVIREGTSSANTANLFGVGNIISLNGNAQTLRPILQQFHAKYYAPSNMALVVYSNESVDQLTEKVIKTFGSLTNTDAPIAQRVPLHDKEGLGYLYKIDSMSDNFTLDLRFDIPTRSDIKSRSLARYIAELIGHEASGSISHYLKENGLAHSVATVYQGDSQNEVLDIYIELTSEGKEDYQKVIHAVFAYINMLSKNEHPSYLNLEVQHIQKHAMNSPVNLEPGDWLSDISDLMLLTTDDPLTFDYHQVHLAQQDIRHFLSFLSPNNMQVFLTTDELEDDQLITPYYEVKYSKSVLSKQQINSWKTAIINELQFPVRNIYLSNNLNNQDLHFLQNSVFAAETIGLKNDALVTIPLDSSYSPTQKLALSLIFKASLQTSLGDNAYYAELAGYRMEFTSNLDAIMVTIHGESSNLSTYLHSILSTGLNSSVTNGALTQAKQQAIYELKKEREDKAFKQALNNVTRLKYGIDSTDSLITFIDDVTLDQYKSFLKKITDKLFVLLPKKGDPSHSALVKKLDNHAFKVPNLTYTELVGLPNNGNAIAYTFWLNGAPAYDQAVMGVLNELISGPFKTEMRVNRKLAYIADTRLSIGTGVSLSFVIESSNNTAEELEAIVRSYLKGLASVEPSLFSEGNINLAKANARRKFEDDLDRNPTNYVLQALKSGVSLSQHQDNVVRKIEALTNEDLLNLLK